MHYIKDLFLKNQNENTHKKFVRYSKGFFCGLFLKIKFSNKDIKLRSSFHICDEILDLISKKIGQKKVFVEGTIIKNCDLTQIIEEQGVGMSKSFKKYGNLYTLF